MILESVKVLNKIKQLYELPRTRERFDKYLFMLQGVEKKEMVLPIASFNPMGKELAMEKLNRLIDLNAEEVLDNIVSEFNNKSEIKEKEIREIKVAINLIDDIEGSWSNFYATDYKSKFEIETLLIRNFCTPAFWTSEDVIEETLSRRIKEYIYRTLYWIENGTPEKLGDLFEQEVTVQMNFENSDSNLSEEDVEAMEKFINHNKGSEDYSTNLNFFYGDEGSRSLNYRTFGIIKNGGFEFAKYISEKRKKPGTNK